MYVMQACCEPADQHNTKCCTHNQISVTACFSDCVLLLLLNSL